MRFPNGYGSIVNLGKKRRRPFAVRITTGWSKDNKQQYKYLGYFEKETQALECLVEYNKNPYDIDTKKITLKAIYDDWSQRHFDKVSLNTIKNYKSAFNKCEHLFNVPIADLKTRDFQKIVDNEITSLASAKAFKNIIKLLYEYALKNEIVEKDYSVFIEMPRNTDKKENIPFTIEEINLLWSHQGNDTIDILLILLYTGMRINELLLLETNNVFINKRYMIGGSKTDNGKDRIIPIHKKIVPLIEKRLNNQPFLFLNRNKKNYLYRNVLTSVRTQFDKLNMSHHIIHETRHTFISQAQRLNLDKISLKKIVGHSTNDITEHYTHKTLDDLIPIIDSFDY